MYVVGSFACMHVCMAQSDMFCSCGCEKGEEEEQDYTWISPTLGLGLIELVFVARFPTDTFATCELHDPSEKHKICRFPDLEALKL